MPRRRTPYRRIRSSGDERDSQRRVLVAVVTVVLVVAVLGLAVWYLGPFRNDNPVDRTSEGQAALTAASEKLGEVEAGDLIDEDPGEARLLLEDAWDDLQRARSGVTEEAWNDVYVDVAAGLETLYAVHEMNGSRFYAAPPGTEITGLVRGPDEVAYAIVDDAVVRVDPDVGTPATVVAAGQGSGQGVGQPRLLARGGPDLLVIDEAGAVWRWRPSDEQGGGTLTDVRVGGDFSLAEVADVETFVIDPDQAQYRLYVPYPPESQILRYEPTADGGTFAAPAPYFVGESEDVSGFLELYIDGDVYAVTEPELIRYFNGRRTGFALDEPPDGENLRPSHSYRKLAATGTRGVGSLFLWDALWNRLLVYDKADGTYVEQYIAGEGSPPLSDVRGMYVVDRGNVDPPILVWALPDGLYRVVLSPDPEPARSPGGSPDASGAPSPRPSGTPRPTPVESGPPRSGDPVETAQPTERPRRTPQVAVPSAGATP